MRGNEDFVCRVPATQASNSAMNDVPTTLHHTIPHHITITELQPKNGEKLGKVKTKVGTFFLWGRRQNDKSGIGRFTLRQHPETHFLRPYTSTLLLLPLLLLLLLLLLQQRERPPRPPLPQPAAAAAATSRQGWRQRCTCCSVP